MILTIILLPVICLVFYLLYISGWLLFSAKIAAVFTGYIRRDGNADLQFVSCRGQVRRVIRFPDEGTYEMDFHSEIYNATGQCRVEWRKKSCEKV